MASLSCSLSGSDALRGFLPDIVEKKHPKVVIDCAHFPNPNPNPNPEPKNNSSEPNPKHNPIPSSSIGSSPLLAQEWFKKPSAVLWPVSVETNHLFSFEESCVEKEEKHMYIEHGLKGYDDGDGVIPVYVMLPLDSINPKSGTVKRPKAMSASMRAVQMAGVKGIVMEVWWGIVEKEGPQNYNWCGYKELLDMAKQWGLKVQVILCFHQCWNIAGGDNCLIPLPPWVREEIEHNPDILFTNKRGMKSYDYISFGCDTLPILQGRSPVQVYADFMRGFRDEFKDYIGEVLVEIQVGLGPGGELQYPSCLDTSHISEFPSFEEFMCYDKYMYASLQACMKSIGEDGFDSTNQCHYKDSLDATKDTSYSQFFREWYSEQLLKHGERVLELAEAIFRGTGSKLSAKVPKALHHHGKEISSYFTHMVAGYLYDDGYLRVMKMFGRHGVALNFTCLEMNEIKQQDPSNVVVEPKGVLKQMTLKATFRAGHSSSSGSSSNNDNNNSNSNQCTQVPISSSRLVDRLDYSGYGSLLCSLILIRMTKQLFLSDAWRTFVKFVEDKSKRAFSHRLSSCHVSTPFLQQPSSK